MFKSMTKAVVSLALMAAAVGVVPAQAAHCDNRAILFTGTILLPNLGAEGCLVNEITGTHSGPNTFYITPGSTTASARFTDSVDPGSFSLSAGGGVVILDCDDVAAGTQAPPCTFTTVAGPDLSVPPDGIPDYYDSVESATLDRLTTIAGGSLTLSAGSDSGTWVTVG